jgi:hypothetical protein
MKKSRVIILCPSFFLIGLGLGYIGGVWHGSTWPSLWTDWLARLESRPRRSIRQGGHYAQRLGSVGMTRADTMSMLARMRARILTNSADVVIAEYGPEGFLGLDGSPLTQPAKVELHFRDGKVVKKSD